MDAANLGTDAAGEDRANTWDSGQLGNDRMRIKLGGDPVIDLFDLGFQEADVFQGEVENTLDGQGQGLVKREAFLGYLLELAGVVVGVWEVVTTEFVQVGGQGSDRS